MFSFQIGESGRNCWYKCPRLISGIKYIFRVSAQNKFGVGKSTNSSVVTAEEQISEILPIDSKTHKCNLMY